MRALIIGAGDAGTRLAQKLCSENHEVVVVDEDVAALNKLETGLDIMTVQGHGANPSILTDAQIKKADVVVCVTKNWDTNIWLEQWRKKLEQNTLSRVLAIWLICRITTFLI